MIKRYSYKKDKNEKLSEHFSVGEFRSHVNGRLTTDNILIDTDLIDKLEKLILLIGADVAFITSAYRDKECDIAVDGSGVGQHVNGKAVDIMFKDVNNHTINTKFISCVAQDLGFGGIARINDNVIHLDTRTGKRYLGDETKSTNTVTSDFYSYYGIKRPFEDKDEQLHQAISKVAKKYEINEEFWQKNYNTQLGLQCLPDFIKKIAEKL